MSANIYSVDFFYTTVEDTPGEGCQFLETLAREDVNLLAFNAFPVGRDRTQLVIYPLNSTRLGDTARKEGLRLIGPHHAFMIHGDDELGSLVDIHKKLFDSNINISSSNGISDGRGGYRYIMHVNPDDFKSAMEILNVDQMVRPVSEFHIDPFRRFQAKG